MGCIKHILKNPIIDTAAEIAAAFIPVVGPYVSAGIGAAANASNHGGSFLGDVTGALQGYGAGQLGQGVYNFGSAAANAASNGAGLAGSLEAGGNATFPTLTNILSGGSSGTLSGGLDAAGNAITSGISGIGNSLSNAGSSALNAIESPVQTLGSIFSGSSSPSGINWDTPSAGDMSINGGNAITALQNTGAPNLNAFTPGAGLGTSASTPALATGGAVGGGGGASSFGSIGSLLNAGSGLLNANATNTATKDLLAAQNQNQANNAPFLASGTAADQRLSDLLGTSKNTGSAGYGSLTTPFNPNNLQNDPGYQFQLQQGNQALQRQQAASGSLDSGAAMKEAQQFGQGLAGTEYNNAFNRNQAQNAQTYGELSGQTNVGLAAANNGNNINNAIGNAGANNTLAQNNNLSGTLGTILGAKIIGYDQSGKPIYAQ